MPSVHPSPLSWCPQHPPPRSEEKGRPHSGCRLTDSDLRPQECCKAAPDLPPHGHVCLPTDTSASPRTRLLPPAAAPTGLSAEKSSYLVGQEVFSPSGSGRRKQDLGQELHMCVHTQAHNQQSKSNRWREQEGGY